MQNFLYRTVQLLSLFSLHGCDVCFLTKARHERNDILIIFKQTNRSVIKFGLRPTLFSWSDGWKLSSKSIVLRIRAGHLHPVRTSHQKSCINHISSPSSVFDALYRCVPVFCTLYCRCLKNPGLHQHQHRAWCTWCGAIRSCTVHRSTESSRVTAEPQQDLIHTCLIHDFLYQVLT